MKKLILLALVLFSAATMLAQTNRMSYQAVVRNAANELVAEENLTVAIRISDANGTSAFSETHSVTSNRNGVISLMIGEGSGQSGSIASVDWRTAQIHTEVTLPGGATLSNTTPVNAVPYAFYADSVDIHWVNDVVDEYLENHDISSIVETDPTVPDWAKEANKPTYDYSEIENTPTIPTVPTNVSAFNNDAGYITAAEVPTVTVPTNVSAFDNDANYITAADIPAIPTVPTDVSAFNNDAGYITAAEVPAVTVPTNVSAFDNDANYITAADIPAIPTVPTDVSAFNNDAGYITAAEVPTVTVPTNVSAFDNDANYITAADIPAIPTVPTDVSAFNNDAGYITVAEVPAVTVPTDVSAFNNDAGYITNADIPAQVNADWNATTGAAQILNKPIDVSAFNNDAGYITAAEVPAITVPTDVSAFNNDAGYITAAEVPAVTVPTDVSAFNNDAGYITNADIPAQVNADWNATTGAAQILNKPIDVSAFNNDAGYITAAEVPAITVPTDVSAFNNDAGYITAAEVPAITVPTNVSAFDNDANYITAADIPAIPTVPTDVSAFNNDAGYITAAEVPAVTVPTNVSAFNNDANYITAADIPTIPTVPTNVSAFDNDANYITAEDIPAIPTVPTDVSAFNNDAGYITAADIPAISTVPTEVSAFTNDANYITNSNTSCANSVDLCELLEKLQQLESQLEFQIFTQGVTAVTQNSFTVNGKVQTDGSTTVSQRGFVYSSTTPTPSISDYRVNCGSGTGTYTYTITGLTPGITYYVRAYATNENGTFYGSVVAVTTTATSPSTLPSVTTIAVTDVGKFRATVSGSVTSDGGESVTQRGFVYGTSSNPTTSNTVATSGSGTGDYTILLSNLQAGTTYYVRAFAVNSKGTAYGNQLTFNTTADEQPTSVENDGQPCPGTPTVTDHEGNVYNTVQIGTQCWTKENMRATTSPTTGTYLITPAGITYTYSGKQARWYNNDSATYAPQNYGLLYNWNAAVDTFNTTYGETSVIPFASDDLATYYVNVSFSGHRRGICPQGWHVPSDAEWTTLTNYLGSHENYYYYDDESYDVPVTNTSYIAKALASTQGWCNSDNTFAVGNSQGTNNASGFSAVPAGNCDGSSFALAVLIAPFWSATQHASSPASAGNRYLGYNDANVGRYRGYKYVGYSVRCLRDNDVPPTSQTQPTVTTSAATNITSTSATLNGSVSNPDGVTITAQGFEWKATTGGTYALVTATGSTGSTMSYALTGLTAGTSYTYCAFVTTAEGTSYGEAVSFTTLAAGGGAVEGDAIPCPGTPTVTDHEGNVYATVQIGTQCWTKENMRATTSPSTGTYLIPATNANYTYTGKQAIWCNNDSATYAPMNYGLLYNWNAAVDTFNTAYGETSVNDDYRNAVSVSFTGNRRGICPEGWHLPSNAEWITMEATVSGSDWQESYATSLGSRGSHAGKLAGGDGWATSSTSGAPGDYSNADRNASGFSAVPVGECHGSSFYGAGLSAYFWSSAQANSSDAWHRFLLYDDAGVIRDGIDKYHGFSVRCLRD